MNMEELKHHEKAALRRLFADKQLPNFFHHNIIQRMKDEQLIQVPRPILRASLAGFSTALLIVGIVATMGFFAGKLQLQAGSQAIAQATGKEKFVLLIHNDDVPPTDPSEQFEAYSKWLGDIKATRFADGEALHGDRFVFTQSADGIKTEQQQLVPGNSEQVSGFFIFEADNAEEAAKIAQSCPHLKYKGTLELRQVFK
jgi:hypothetical protein